MRPWLGFLLACSVAFFLVSGYVLYEIYLLDKSDETLQEQLKGLYSEENGAQEPDRNDSQAAEPEPFVVDAGVLALHEENPEGRTIRSLSMPSRSGRFMIPAFQLNMGINC